MVTYSFFLCNGKMGALPLIWQASRAPVNAASSANLVLEHLAVLIGYRDFHVQRSFSNLRGQAAAFLLFLL